MLTTIIVVVVIYFLAMLGIGWYGRRYSANFDSYLSMGKSGGILLLIGGTVGANIGNGFVVGGAGAGASQGLAGSAYGLACAVTALVAVFLCDIIYKNNYSSLADFTRARYHSEVPGVIYDISTACASIGLLAGQLMAGKALFEALGMSGTVGVLCIAVVVFGYSQLAGLWGAFATSVVQTAIIAAGLLLTAFVLFSNGAVGTIQAAQAAGTAILGENRGHDDEHAVDGGHDRREDSRDDDRADDGGQLVHNDGKERGVTHGTIDRVAVCADEGGHDGKRDHKEEGNKVRGLRGLGALGGADAGEDVLVSGHTENDGQSHCEERGGGGAAEVQRTGGILMGTMKKEYSEKQLSKMTLVLNVLIMVGGCALALNAGSILDMLNAFYSFLAAACFVPFIGGLLWKKGSAKGAIAASVVGIATVVLGWLGVSLPSLGGFFPCIPGALAFVIVSLIAPDKAQ